MARRYGRNQKRAHRERIAELEARLRRESIAGFYLPHGDEPDLEKFVRVLQFRSTVEGGVHDMIRRELELVVTGLESVIQGINLEKLWMDQSVIQFRGRRYVMVNASHDMQMDSMTLNLTGVA